jgi:hypothetical protein
MGNVAANPDRRASRSARDRDADRRSDHRLRVRLPVGVRGTDISGASFEEKTFSEDVCRGGMSFVLSRSLAPGLAVEIRLPLPSPVGKREQSDFATQGQVRHVESIESGSVVGVIFVGPRLHQLFLPESAAQA